MINNTHWFDYDTYLKHVIEENKTNNVDNLTWNISSRVRILLSRINKKNNKNSDLIDEFVDWIKDREINKWKSRADIKKVLLRSFDKIAVPWKINFRWEFVEKTDFDSKVAVFLFRKMWFKGSPIYTKDKTKLEPKAINLNLWDSESIYMDWYDVDWLRSFLSTMTIWLNKKWLDMSSTSQLVFNFLNELWAFDSNNIEQIKRLVNFTNLKEKNLEIYAINTDTTKPYLNSHRTVYWLSDNMTIDSLYAYFSLTWRTWFETLTYEELNSFSYRTTNKKLRTYYEISLERKKLIDKSIASYEYYSSFDNFSYKNQKLEFVVDYWNKIYNPYEVSSFYWTGLIQITKNKDIIIFNPKTFSKKFENVEWLKKWEKIFFISSDDKDYIKKIDTLFWLFKEKHLAEKIIKSLVASEEFVPENSLFVKSQKKEIELKKKQETIKKQYKELKREKRKSNIWTNFLKQKVYIDEIKEWMKLKWKIINLLSHWRMLIKINLESWKDEWTVYTTQKRLKDRVRTTNKVIDNKLAIIEWVDRENIIYNFVVTKIDRDSKKILLKQL